MSEANSHQSAPSVTSVRVEGDVTLQSCLTCAHGRCMFHGEDRPPVYIIGIKCWVDPLSNDGLEGGN